MLIQRLVEKAISGRDLVALDDLSAPVLAPKLRPAFMQFREAFDDWRQTDVELVAEGETVVARFRCEGTQNGDWLGTPATGRKMRINDGRIARLWGLEDTWTRRRQFLGADAHLGDPLAELRRKHRH
ncbi:ester cyclase [Microvirga roseola]|uniref:ester cyclase n=1 Tax=Microvirga roseola TaxID=2883126 RepID=UPI001E5A85F4|nr:ester cyclase [Microvirga roseola]